MGRLRVGETLHNDAGARYEVEGVLGRGGFGTAYAAHRVSAQGRSTRDVVVKVCRSLEDWHGEAYFGRLLRGDPRVVQLLDAFVAPAADGGRSRHVLVLERMSEGTVWDAVEADALHWSEGRVRAEIRALLKVLRRLHGGWVIHRDIKPDNVYLRAGRLVLGDFGITKLALDHRGAAASRFQPDFAPRDLGRHAMWGPAEDIFQVGLLAATLLSGEVWWNDTVSARSIARLDAGDAFKSWIWHATGARSHRYWHAEDALDALTSLRQVDVRPGRAPRTLRGHSVVFSGRLPGTTRARAVARARAAGAHPQTALSDATTVVVSGTVGGSETVTMFGVRERLRTGQPIRVISPEQFHRLSSPPPPHP